MKNLFSIFLLLIFSLTTVCAQQTQEEKLAIQYYQDAEYEKAEQLLKKIYAKKKDSYLYSYYYHTLIKLQNFKELERVAKAQIRAYPNTVRYNIDLGYVYEISEQRDKAEKVYNEAIKDLAPNDGAVRMLYSAFISKAKRDYAINTILKGRKITNNKYLFSMELTNIYVQLNQTQKVIDEAMMLVEDDDLERLPDAENILQKLLLDDEDKQKYLLTKATLQRNIQKNSKNYSYVALLYWILQINKEFEEAFILAKSVDKRSKSDGSIIYDFAEVTAKNRKYDLSIEALEYLLKQGETHPLYTAAQYLLLDVKYQNLISHSPINYLEAITLEQDFKALLDENGVHSGTADWVRKYANLLAFYVNKADEAVALLNDMIEKSVRAPRDRALYKVDLADILLFKGDVWDATLLYSQVDKEMPNDTIGQLAKFKNAKLSFYIGEFGWSLSQLDILRAATTKLIANDAMYLSFVINDNLELAEEEEEDAEEDLDSFVFDELAQLNKPLKHFAQADMMLFRNQMDDAVLYLDSVLYIAPYGKLNDDVYFMKAKILTRQNEFFAAEEMYKKILMAYSSDLLADDALFYLAELYDYYINDVTKAMETYQQLLKEHPDSLFAVDARKRFRTLRGDILE